MKDDCDGNDDTGNDNRIGRSLPPYRSVIIDPLNCHAAVDCLWHWKRFGHDLPMTIAIGILPTAHGHLPACHCQNNFGAKLPHCGLPTPKCYDRLSRRVYPNCRPDQPNCHIAACQRQNVMTDCHVVSTPIAGLISQLATLRPANAKMLGV